MINYRNLSRYLSLCLLLSMLIFNVNAAAIEFVVVVNKNNAMNTLSKREVIDIYMGRYLTFPDGEMSQPVDLPAQSSLKNDFYQQLVNKNEQKINAYWARLLFSGRAKPPAPATSVEDVLKKVEASQFAIGYIPKSQMTNAVKVVYQFDEN